jgi:hypothetical protein
MAEFTLHPNIYKTGRSAGLINLLEQVWVRDHVPGDGTFYIISGFANYNGGVRFYNVFREHIQEGGQVVAYLGGSTAQHLSSQQSVQALLECGAEVNIINRKRLMHAKCYGAQTSKGQKLIVTSGNFTGPAMSQNVEAALLLDTDLTRSIQFSWSDLINNLQSQRWQFYKPTLNDRANPGWRLLYDEVVGAVKLDETQEVTLIMVLGHNDTARIQATPGSDAAKGTQYFWLSKDSYDFFPPLTVRNQRGVKTTYSTLISLKYIDIGEVDRQCRVTFEAENNFDFRLGTGRLRYTRMAQKGDIAAITRISETEYELRIYNDLLPYAINFIGHRGKKFGYISNQEFAQKTGFRLGI